MKPRSAQQGEALVDERPALVERGGARGERRGDLLGLDDPPARPLDARPVEIRGLFLDDGHGVGRYGSGGRPTSTDRGPRRSCILYRRSMARDEPEPSRGYGQYCPISRAVEVLGERWSLLILRDMLVGATRFNDIARGNPGLSRSLLSKRLRQLERAQIVEHVEDRWLLTDAGRDLEDLVFGLGRWGARWQFDEPARTSSTPGSSCGGCTTGSTTPRWPTGGW